MKVSIRGGMTLKEIGSSFYDELAGYGGLVDEHFIEFFDETPAKVINSVHIIYEAHDPLKWNAELKFSEQVHKSLQEAETVILRCLEAGIFVSHELAVFRKDPIFLSVGLAGGSFAILPAPPHAKLVLVGYGVGRHIKTHASGGHR